MKRVAVALSGGVDSLVAAVLLKKSGASLIGVFMKNWEEREETGECRAESEYRRVQELCAALEIPCTRVDFVKEYWNEVFTYFIWSYQRGHTPNPDILCNRHIKFSALHRYCQEHLQVDAIATGHYARLHHTGPGAVKLKMAVDSLKDQTYFLSQVSQSALSESVFPVGQLMKREVREMASEAGFSHVAQQRESMGLCFIGKRDFSQFISEYVEDRPGRFLSLTGSDLGCHRGHHLFTVGQRARIGGRPRPFYVATKDPLHNTVTVVEGTDHPALFTSSFITSPPHWISDDPLIEGPTPFRCKLRHRHQSPLIHCTVVKNGQSLQVACDDALRAVAPGQYAVFYSGDTCLGGACITATGPSLWQHSNNNH